MTKLDLKYLNEYAELSPSLEESDVDENPAKVIKTAFATAIVTLEDDASREESEPSQSEIEAKQADLAERIFSGDSGDSGNKKDALKGYRRHSAMGSTELVESSDGEELSDDEQDEVSQIQEDLAERIFSN